MIGAIVGDFVGSAYEFAPTKNYNFELVTPASEITDDSIMSLAIADAILRNADEEYTQPDYKGRMLYWGHKYPNPKGSYGNSFKQWLTSSDPQPYYSFGNGSAMRVPAIGWAFPTLYETQLEAYYSAEYTHNHPEGIKGAVATASAIWLARHHYDKEYIRQYIEQQFSYDLNFTIVGIKQHYGFSESCMDTVPAAIVCFLDSTDYVDCIRMAVSLGGDADTLACIAGGIAEAYYGTQTIPVELVNAALVTLPNDLLVVLMDFSERFYK